MPLPTLPDVVQVVDAQLKTSPVDITSSPHWRAKEIEAAVACAMSSSTPAEAEPTRGIVASAEQVADETDGAETPASVAGTIAAAEQAVIPDANVTQDEAVVSPVATAQSDVPAAAMTAPADNLLPSARAAETDAEVNVGAEAGVATAAVAATATEAEAMAS